MSQIEVRYRWVADVVWQQDGKADVALALGIGPADAERIADFVRMSPCLPSPAIEQWLRMHRDADGGLRK
jgi:hypothetical protein